MRIHVNLKADEIFATADISPETVISGMFHDLFGCDERHLRIHNGHLCQVEEDNSDGPNFPVFYFTPINENADHFKEIEAFTALKCLKEYLKQR